MEYRTFGWLAVFALAGGLVVGCAGGSTTDDVPTADVSGTIRLDGQPLEGADVLFMAQDYAGYGKTDSSGKYGLKAKPGENKVTVSKAEGQGAGEEGAEAFDWSMMAEEMPNAAKLPGQLIPERYRHPGKTELKFNVTEDGSRSADFDLTGN